MREWTAMTLSRSRMTNVAHRNRNLSFDNEERRAPHFSGDHINTRLVYGPESSRNMTLAESDIKLGLHVGRRIYIHGVKTRAESVRTIGRVDFTTHSHVDDFRFVKEHTRVTPKMTIPAPNMLHFGRAGARSGNRSIPIWSRFSRTSPTRRARRCTPFMMPAAAICSSTTPPGR